MQEDAPLYWLEVAESVPVRFGDLAQMMAAAQFPGESERAALSQVVAAENIGKQLTRMVAAGTLTVRNRHGMSRLDAPMGRQLAEAVLIPNLDLAPLRAEFGIGIRFAPHGNGPDLWTIEHAAAHLAEQEEWTDAARDTLRQQMLCAARAGRLNVRHPHTALPVPPEKRDTVRDFYELVTPEDVNAWLESVRAPYRWLTTEQAEAMSSDASLPEEPSAARSTGRPADQANVPNMPPPMATPEIADAFDGIADISAQQWRDRLGDVNNHSWLLPARVAKGKAPNPAMWSPLELARLLLRRGANADSLNRKFLIDPKLRPWRAEWQELQRGRNAFGM